MINPNVGLYIEALYIEALYIEALYIEALVADVFDMHSQIYSYHDFNLIYRLNSLMPTLLQILTIITDSF